MERTILARWSAGVDRRWGSLKTAVRFYRSLSSDDGNVGWEWSRSKLLPVAVANEGMENAKESELRRNKESDAIERPPERWYIRKDGRTLSSRMGWNCKGKRLRFLSAILEEDSFETTTERFFFFLFLEKYQCFSSLFYGRIGRQFLLEATCITQVIILLLESSVMTEQLIWSL